jgi:hypothetical protein
MKQTKLFICFLFFVGFNTRSQSLYYEGIFPTIDHSGNFNSKLDYGLYYFGAFPIANLNEPNINKDANFLLFYSEQSLTFKVSSKFSFTGSYVYQRANAVYDNYVNENRFYAQAKYKHSLKKTHLTHRVRFDGRFIQNPITNETPFTHRARYLIGLECPLKSKKNNLYFTMYEEAFFNTVSNAGTVYEENWAYAALGIKLNEKNKIETGLLYITWNIGKTNWFNQYYLQLTWISHLDFSKKQKTTN